MDGKNGNADVEVGILVVYSGKSKLTLVREG
jgi:hypothetical protein